MYRKTAREAGADPVFAVLELTGGSTEEPPVSRLPPGSATDKDLLLCLALSAADSKRS